MVPVGIALAVPVAFTLQSLTHPVIVLVTRMLTVIGEPTATFVV